VKVLHLFTIIAGGCKEPVPEGLISEEARTGRRRAIRLGFEGQKAVMGAWGALNVPFASAEERKV
jgi:hypothetical protein